MGDTSTNTAYLLLKLLIVTCFAYSTFLQPTQICQLQICSAQFPFTLQFCVAELSNNCWKIHSPGLVGLKQASS